MLRNSKLFFINQSRRKFKWIYLFFKISARFFLEFSLWLMILTTLFYFLLFLDSAIFSINNYVADRRKDTFFCLYPSFFQFFFWHKYIRIHVYAFEKVFNYNNVSQKLTIKLWLVYRKKKDYSIRNFSILFII